MMRVTFLTVLLLSAGTLGAYAQEPALAADSAFVRGDYETAREHLQRALSATGDSQQQIALRRKIGVTYIFEGKLNDAREEYQELIDVAAAARWPADAHDHYALAAIGALQHKKHEVLTHTLAAERSKPVTPYAPMFQAIVWAHVGELDRVLQAREQMSQAAAAAPGDSIAQQAAALARAIYAVKIREFELVRSEMAGITAPSLKAFATAFLANGLRREGDRAAAHALDAEVRKYREFNIYSAVANRLIK